MTNQDKADRLRALVKEAASLEKELNEDGFKVRCTSFGDYRNSMTFKNMNPPTIIKQISTVERL